MTDDAIEDPSPLSGGASSWKREHGDTMKLVHLLAAMMATAVIPLAAHAQSFPEKGSTLRIIVPFAAGGGVDNAARLLAEQLRKQLATPVVVENKAGAGGTGRRSAAHVGHRAGARAQDAGPDDCRRQVQAGRLDGRHPGGRCPEPS